MESAKGSKVYDIPSPKEAIIRWDDNENGPISRVLYLGDRRQIVNNDEVKKLYEGLMSFKQHGDSVTIVLAARGPISLTFTIVNDERLAIRYDGATYEYVCHPADFLYITERVAQTI